MKINELVHAVFRFQMAPKSQQLLKCHNKATFPEKHKVSLPLNYCKQHEALGHILKIWQHILKPRSCVCKHCYKKPESCLKSISLAVSIDSQLGGV